MATAIDPAGGSQRVAETVDAVISIIEEGYADNSLRNVGSSRVVAYGVLGIVGWTHRWYRPDRSDVSAEEIGKTYAEMLLSGLEKPLLSLALPSDQQQC